MPREHSSKHDDARRPAVTRNWLYVRLRPAPPSGGEAHGMTGMPALIDHLRSADPDGRWAFQRLIDHSGPHVGVWLYSRAEVLHELGVRAGRLAPEPHPAGPGQQTPLSARYLGDRAARTATDLSHLSSEFALDLLAAGELREGEQLGLAVAHLAHLAQLVPARNRAAFLFQCWQFRAAELPGATRVALMTRARNEAGAVLATVTAQAMQPGHRAVWERYLDGLARLVAVPGVLDAQAYVVFDHAHLTHNRLGIGSADEALAAQVVRTALLDGLDLPGARIPELQPV
ncbi:lantibiotic dehydratase C-terminal domain-containing protein [Actinoplanes sp. NPDC048967]|uniref:lantibiotic dehydratase C-terminal domain-containing protein n=1 Tax=Actinoplanes sp. NPDC048967 TaxID=3155269 RepID=UPI0033CD2BCA